jgi:hypothetical protein
MIDLKGNQLWRELQEIDTWLLLFPYFAVTTV